MAIMVQFKDKSFGFVQNHALEDLIAADDIVAFRRADGWVEIGRDQVRASGVQGGYRGPERRASSVKMNCLTCDDFIDTLCRTGTCPSRVSMKEKYS